MRPGNWTHQSERAKGPEVTWFDPLNHERDNPKKTMVPAFCSCGKDAVQFIAEAYWGNGDYPEAFTIEIILPKGWAGRYAVAVEHEPVFKVAEEKAA